MTFTYSWGDKSPFEVLFITVQPHEEQEQGTLS